MQPKTIQIHQAKQRTIGGSNIKLQNLKNDAEKKLHKNTK